MHEGNMVLLNLPEKTYCRLVPHKKDIPHTLAIPIAIISCSGLFHPLRTLQLLREALNGPNPLYYHWTKIVA